MSQTYRIQLKAAVSRRVDASDSVSYPIAMADILPPEDMTGLLGTALAEAGFAADASGRILTRDNDDGSTTTVDLDALTATTTLSDARQVATVITVTGRGYEEQRAQADAQRRLAEEQQFTERELDQRGRAALEQELADRLTAGEAERLQELNTLIQGVYAAALKRKAASMGEVVEISESTDDDGEYELRITVET